MVNGKDNLDKIIEGRWVDKVETNYSDTIRIRKCRVKDLKLVSRFIGTLVSDLGLNNDGTLSVDIRDTGVMLRLISNSAEEIYRACATLTDKDVEYLEELDLDDGVKVVMKAYEINKDFFMKQVYPMVSPLLIAIGLDLGAKAAISPEISSPE